MKKEYRKPTLWVMETQTTNIICSSVTGINTNATIKYGGAGRGQARIKSASIWDDDDDSAE
ncbi:MAG: hypothetical protein IJ901_04735 [Bacteroidaceae bacterium]|nr:hypothetical protein [Bacteroidaceae bacterium]